ncbi:MAG TPA: PrgI family protein [Candidatus Paceibacterota bacterium]|nr:PrgI family protein [Candidatus Paceibacterota bacterium]
MRFEVPQFIEVEAKIIGPFTWKQFVYLAGGVGVLVILFLSAPFFVFLIFGFPLFIIAGALAFQKINNRPISIFFESVFNYVIKKKLYLWRKTEQQHIIEQSNNTSASNVSLAYTNQKTLHKLSHNLELHNSKTE